MKKKFLFALLLALIVCLVLIPTCAFAEGEQAEEPAVISEETAYVADNEVPQETEEAEPIAEGEEMAEPEPTAPPAEDEPDSSEPSQNLDVSNSKTASELNGNGESDITISLPSAEEALSTDIVFVLDESDCASDVAKKIPDLVAELEKIQKENNSNIKVGIVLFKGSAMSTEMMDIQDAMDALTKIQNEGFTKDSFKEVCTSDKEFISSASNLHSGLMAAQQLLGADSEKDVDNSRKYVVTITDGMTYYWNDHEGNVYGIYSSSDGNGQNFPSTLFYGWYETYGVGNSGKGSSEKINSETWDQYIADTREKINEDYSVNIYEAEEKFNATHSDVRFSTRDELDNAGYKYIDTDRKRDTYNGDKVAHGIERSFIACLDTVKDMTKSGYKFYAYNPSYTEMYVPGLFTSKLNEMAGHGNIDNFDIIRDRILYAVSAGSTIEDVIGDKFDVVDGSFFMTVGGEKVAATKDENDPNALYFGEKVKDEDGNDTEKYAYELRYTPGDKEKFVLTINTNVSNFAPVQLNYKVKLNERSTAPGTYGVKDLNGDKIVDNTEDTAVDPEKALYTNNEAVLTPVDSKGVKYKTITLPKPSVSYTVGQLPTIPTGRVQLTVGVTSSVHQDILTKAAEILARQGIKLNIKVYDDELRPNEDLAEGKISASLYENHLNVNLFDKEYNEDLLAVAEIDYVPMEIFGNGIKSLSELPADAKILIPVEGKTRALRLLAANGIIVLADGSESKEILTLDDVADAKGHELVLAEELTILHTLDAQEPGTIALINAEYVLNAEHDPMDGLAADSLSREDMVNLANDLVIKAEDKDSELIQALIDALTGDEMRDYINENYKGIVIPMF